MASWYTRGLQAARNELLCGTVGHSGGLALLSVLRELDAARTAARTAASLADDDAERADILANLLARATRELERHHFHLTGMLP